MVRDKNRSFINGRALLDTGASNNFISENMVKRLGSQINPCVKTITTIDGMKTITRGSVQIMMKSCYSDFCTTLTCLIMPKVAEFVPCQIFQREGFQIPRNLQLADPDFHLPRAIDLLLGSGKTLSMLAIGQITLTSGGVELCLQKTRLGWIIAGGISDSLANEQACHLARLENTMNKFWEIEEVTLTKGLSKEESECEAHFKETVTRHESGRYIVRLPFRTRREIFVGSKENAAKRYAVLENRFSKNDTLKEAYTKTFKEYLELEHMSLIDDADDGGYYMPHHAVVKEASCTTKLRVVFDASAKDQEGISLNDLLKIGPTIQNRLVSHLTRFRMHRYIITADIEKMYRQILVHQEDRRFQRVLWRHEGIVRTFQLNTLTFGVSSSPYLAIRTIQRLAEDERADFPKAAEILKNHLYVDDLLTGANTIEEAREIRNDIISLLSRGGFRIRQWASNDPRIINDLPAESVHAHFIINIDTTLKTLGITWNADTDEICYIPKRIQICKTPTKRIILSELAKVFDPLGLLGPIIFYLKWLMQNIWRQKINWDESLPQGIYTDWLNFVRQWEIMGTISFDRNLLIPNCKNIQLHGFCDASSRGYGACLYIRSQGQDGNIATHLLGAKSRVAPIKPTTIPRLELCGATLLAQLYNEVSKTIDKRMFESCTFWCDSTIVLCWLNTPPHKLKTYVANRVMNTKQLSEGHEWRHINSKENPADAISRGQLPIDFANNKLWRHGPNWLSSSEKSWPKTKYNVTMIPELKEETCFSNCTNDFDVFTRFSSYAKTTRIVAYCLRVCKSNKYRGPLCIDELNEAEEHIIKLLQGIHFSDVIVSLNKPRNTSPQKFANLSPFQDDRGVLRVGGRIHKSNLSFGQKHPILMPKQHLTTCITRESHCRLLHAGVQTTLYDIRQKYWISNGRNYVRKVIRSCMRCFRFRTNTVNYKMGNLPASRVSVGPPFTHTGIDFCGPFFIKEKKFRNRNRIKVYVCVFICMSVKAVHLEVVTEMTADAFLAALSRFSSRRGLPAHIYSDNGTNFVGANNKIKEIYDFLDLDENKQKFMSYALSNQFTWHFIPPASPHFGGLWESTVRVFKHHLQRVVGDILFTLEEFNTFVVEIEGVLNSRPIMPISTDPNDIQALSPSHYLIGKSLTSVPEKNLSSVPDNRLSVWQHITKVRQDFWKRWSLEYLNELQIRNKWQRNSPNIKIGTLVLIKNKAMPCSQWAMGRIIETHAGEDNIVRVVTIRTLNGNIRRTIKYICPLPDDANIP
ncbi:uncharacterized protein [Prorops nasuta]|uniref:uncharacterized protein n=1 Tax=Prorops nasuta TaxID=863751 RepID=UPI0034CFA337